MKYVARQQVKKLFKNPLEAMANGLWFSGYEGEGEYKVWYNNNKLFVHSFYKNGELDGEFKQWWRNGEFIYHKLYKNGEEIKDYLK